MRFLLSFLFFCFDFFFLFSGRNELSIRLDLFALQVNMCIAFSLQFLAECCLCDPNLNCPSGVVEGLALLWKVEV